MDGITFQKLRDIEARFAEVETSMSDPAVVQIARDANLPILAMVTNFRQGWRATDLHHLETRQQRHASARSRTWATCSAWRLVPSAI